MPGLEAIHDHAIGLVVIFIRIEVAHRPWAASFHAIVLLQAHFGVAATQLAKELLNIFPFLIKVVPRQMSVVFGVAEVKTQALRPRSVFGNLPVTQPTSVKPPPARVVLGDDMVDNFQHVIHVVIAART